MVSLVSRIEARTTVSSANEERLRSVLLCHKVCVCVCLCVCVCVCAIC